MPIIRKILTKEYEKFRPMVFEQYRKFLHAGPDAQILAVGAWMYDIPCGIILYQLPKKQGSTAMLLSIFVNPLFRRQGIGDALLEKSSKMLKSEGYKGIEGQYQQEYKMKEAIERLLEKAGWTYAPFRLLAYSTYIRFLEDPLLRRIAQLPKDFSYFLWKDLLPDEADTLKEQYKAKIIPPIFYPLLPMYDNFLHQCSVGLRHKGEVIGWMIVLPHHIPKQIHFANMYVKPQYARRGFGLALVYESSRLEYEHLGSSYDSNIDGGLWQVSYDNPRMVHITKQKLGKHCHKIVHYNLAKKSLA